MMMLQRRRIFVISKKKLTCFMVCCLSIPFVFTRLIWFLTANDTTFAGCTPKFNNKKFNLTNDLLKLLPTKDFEQLVDLNNFEYIMEQPACTANITALMLVHTAPTHFNKRLRIRETWAQPADLQGTPLRLLFLLGAVADQNLQKNLLQENEMFADMVQGNFVDDYQNMTYKHTMAFKWFIYNCAQAHILIKLDDDVFVNIYQLLEYAMEESQYDNIKHLNSTKTSIESDDSMQSSYTSLKSAKQLFHHPQCLLCCSEFMPWSPIRRTFRSKWHLRVRDYPGYYFPQYCSGYAVIYSPDVLIRLYLTLQSTEYFWIDDVFITGKLAKRLKIQHTLLTPYVLSKDTYEDLRQGKVHLAEMEFIFTWPYITEEQIRKLWLQKELSHRRHK